MGKPLIQLPSNVAPGPLAGVLSSAAQAELALGAAREAATDSERVQQLQVAVGHLIAAQKMLVTRLTGMDD